MLRDVVESEAGWEAPVEGFNVNGVNFSGAIYITAYGQRAEDETQAPSTTITLGGAFSLVDRSGVDHHLSAEDPWDTLTPLFSLRHDSIQSAIADRIGWLVVKFDSGVTLEAGPDGRYENWQLMGPGGILIVGTPGGGEPAVWGAATGK